MDLPTYTNIWRIEKRLYKLYDFRLPAPLPITWIAVFAGITVPYVVFLVAVGLPFDHNLVWLYVLPPGVLTWLTTRPVIESKRLPELISSQLRYLAEPRSWNRMAPAAEKDEIFVTVRVWHRYPPKQRRKAAKEAKVAKAKAGKTAKATKRNKRAGRQTGPQPVGPQNIGPQNIGPQHVRPPVVATAPEASRHVAPAHLVPGSAELVTRHRVPAAPGPAPALRQRPHGPAQSAPGSVAQPAPGSVAQPLHGPAGQPVRVPAGPPAMPQRALHPQAKPPQVQSPPVQTPQVNPPQVNQLQVRPSAVPPRETPSHAGGGARPRPWPGTPEPDGPSLTDAVDSWFARSPASPRPVPPAPIDPVASARPAASAEEVLSPEDTLQSEVTSPPETPEAPEKAEAPEEPEEAEAPESTQAPEPSGPVAADRASVAAPAPPVAEPPLAAVISALPTTSARPAFAASAPPASTTDVPSTATAERPVIGRWRPRPAPLMPLTPQSQVTQSRPPAPLADESPLTGQYQEPSIAPAAADVPTHAPTPWVSQPWAPDALVVTSTGLDEPAAAPAASPEAAATEPEEAAASEPEGEPEVTPGPAKRTAPSPLELSHDVPEDVADWFPADIPPTSYEPAPPMPRNRPARQPRPTPPAVHANGSHPADPLPPHRAVPANPLSQRPDAPPLHRPDPAPRPPKVVDLDAERPVPSIERALSAPSSRRDVSWRRRVKVVVGGQGPGKRDQEALDRDRARLPLTKHKTIVVLGCHGGAGQTLTTLMTGRLLASLRGHRVAVLDLNAATAKAGTRTSGGNLDIIATTQAQAQAQSQAQAPDYDALAERYPLLVIDPAPSGLPRVLAIADQLIIVAPPTPEGASSLANTQQWLDAHGHGDLAARAVTVLNGVTRQAMADVLRAESVARGRCRAIVRIPWDDDLTASRPQVPQAPQTRLAYTALAGVVVAGMAAPAPAGAGRSPVEHEG